MAKLSFSIYNKDHQYTGNEPCFYSSDEFNWIKPLEENWQTILEELDQFIVARSAELTPYFHKALIEKGDWKTLSFLFWSIKVPENFRSFPKTAKLIEKIPNLVSASFSLLEPNTSISPHYGDTNAIIRCHLGLSIPGKLPECGLKVGAETRSWENGKILLFCDAHEHSAFNHTDRKRFVFLFDILKPEFTNKKLYVCSGVLAQLSLFYLSEKLKIKRLPLWLLFIFHKLAQIAFAITLPVKNKLAELLSTTKLM